MTVAVSCSGALRYRNSSTNISFWRKAAAFGRSRKQLRSADPRGTHRRQNRGESRTWVSSLSVNGLLVNYNRPKAGERQSLKCEHSENSDIRNSPSGNQKDAENPLSASFCSLLHVTAGAPVGELGVRQVMLSSCRPCAARQHQTVPRSALLLFSNSVEPLQRISTYASLRLACKVHGGLSGDVNHQSSLGLARNQEIFWPMVFQLVLLLVGQGLEVVTAIYGMGISFFLLGLGSTDCP